MAAAAPAADAGKEAAKDPAAQYNAEALQLNDETVDMLMCLDYETRFCTKELRAMPRTFFVYQAPNQAHQFKYFSSLVVWALGLIGIAADWDEYEDPNTVIMRMMVVLKDSGVQANAVPGKLK